MSRSQFTTINQKVLFLALSGIGNFLMQLPTIEVLKKARPNWLVTVWVAPRHTKALAQAAACVDQVIVADPKRSLMRHGRLVLQLARLHPSITVMLSPGQLIKGAAYMYLMGAEKRIAHRYFNLGNPSSDFLLTHSIDEAAGSHDIDQNLNLLELLDIAVAPELGRSYHFSPPAANIALASTELNRLGLSRHQTIIGLHAGSASKYLWKRWPAERFAEVGKSLIKNHHAHVLIFGGPDEMKQKYNLRHLIGLSHTSIIAADILTVAALIKHCKLFIANDSGLMHLAAAQSVPTFGIFGPTDETLTGPRGSKSHVLRAPDTKPVYHTERNFTLGQEPHDSLLKITPPFVLESLIRYL